MFNVPSELRYNKPGIGRTLILVGKNGSGKSMLLNEVAHYYMQQGRQVITIANTIYDKFSTRGYKVHRLSASTGHLLPQRTLKQAINNASEEGFTKLRQLTQTLKYCGYDGKVGLHVKGFSTYSLKHFPYNETDIGLSKTDFDELMSLSYKYQSTKLVGEPLWLDFNDYGFEAINRSGFARLIKWEGTLKKYKIIKSIDLLLSRKGRWIPMKAASSGELSLIATMVFLTSTADIGCVVLVDEPENSLHPQWQREYVRLITNLLHYYQPLLLIATHAPLIVSGAQIVDNLVEVFEVIFSRLNLEMRPRPHPPSNVEGLLWKAFDTVTPENHFISEKLVHALNELSNNKISLDEAEQLIESIKRNSYDQKQEDFLDSVKDMAKEVARRGSNE